MRRLLIGLLCFGCRAEEATEPPRPEPDPIAVEQPEPEPEPEPESEPEPEPEPQPEPEPKPEPVIHEPPPDPDAPTFLTAVLSPKRVAKTAYGPAALATLNAFPGFVFDDVVPLDHALITSNAPESLQAITIVVEHRMDEAAFAAAIDSNFGEPISWVERDGKPVADPPDPDPRLLVIVDDKHAAYIHPDLLAKVDEHVDELRAFLRKNRRTSLSARVDPRLVPKRSPWEHWPDTITLTGDASDTPTLDVEFTYPNPDAAKAFVRFWEDELSKILSESLMVRMTAYPIYEGTTVQRNESRVSMRTTLEPSQAEIILGTFRDAFERFDRLSAAPLKAR